MYRRRTILALLIALLLPGCGDDDDGRPLPAAATSRPSGAALDLALKPLTPLLPNRPTHATVDRLGNVYWVQETDRGDDTMFVIGEGGIPRATQLTVPNVAALLGAGSGARGNIHGIAAASEAGGDVYFYFQGTEGRRTLACIGAFTPKTERVRVLADSDGVAAATGMGRSLPLARASVCSDGRVAWVWLRHTDNWAVFRLDPVRLPTSGPAQLQRAFESVRLNGQAVEMTRDGMEIAPAPGGALFLLDIPGARLLQIAPDGTATLVRPLAGLPAPLSAPAVDREQNLVLFAGNGNLIGVKGQDTSVAAAVAAAKVDSTYPAMLIFKPDKVVSIGRDEMQAYPGFPVFSMRLRQLIPHARDGGWVSYDAGSGELLHVKIVENLWR